MPKYCSPSREDYVMSCYNDSEITHILTTIGREPTDSREKNITIIKEHFKECQNDDCWEIDFNTNSIFRPKHLWKSNKWLFDQDINNVLVQYEEVYPNYVHLGSELMDFWYYSDNELLHKSIKSLVDSGKTIFSLALLLRGYVPTRYDIPHWVGVIIDIDRQTISYMDSVKYNMNPIINYLLYEIQMHFTMLTRKSFTVLVNKVDVQLFSSDCGIFVVDFVVKYLNGYDLDKYINMMLMTRKDQKKYIDELREYYFR